VGPFVRHHAEAVVANLPCPFGDRHHHRWTLDTDADLRFLRAFFARLPAGPAGWDWKTGLAVVEADPALPALNRAVAA
jgi:hypothetical protein